MKNLEDKIVEKKSSLNDKIDHREIQQFIQEALSSQNAFNEQKLESVEVRLQHVLSVSQGDLKKLESLYLAAGAKSMALVRLLIVALLIQFAVLYYITYYVAGWDVGEPISYLIAIAVEIAGSRTSSSAGLLHQTQGKPLSEHSHDHLGQAASRKDPPRLEHQPRGRPPHAAGPHQRSGHQIEHA